MRVVFNQIAALEQRAGIGHYAAQLFRCLSQATAPGTMCGYPSRSLFRVRNGLRWLRGLGRTHSDAASVGLGRPGEKSDDRGFLARCFRIAARWGKYDLYHEPNCIPFPTDLPTVVTVHDLSVLLYPQWHPPARVREFERHFAKELARCAHFVSGSEFSRQELIRAFGLAPERVTRIYHGVRPGLRPLPPEDVALSLRRLGLPPRYLLCLGTIEPRKNVLRLLRAYCALDAGLRERWPLLLVGGWGWNTSEVADYFHRHARQRGVVHLGYVNDTHLPALYNGARALVYPSFYEGFGLPPVEMLACGGAVLASTAGAVAETTRGQAFPIDPEDDDGWRAGLQRVLIDDDWWQALRRGATEAARPYTWEKCAVDTLRVYQHVCGLTAYAPTATAA